MPELYLILIFMIAASFIAVQMKDLLSAVIAVGAAGLGLSVAFLMLKAPDLAITQLVVEILCLILLIKATIKRDDIPAKDFRGVFTTLMVLIFIAVFLCVSYVSLQELPQFGRPLMRIANTFIQTGQAKTGAANLVSSVVLDFRAYDTLGEAAVLFTAVIGTLAVLRRIGRKRKGEGSETDEE